MGRNLSIRNPHTIIVSIFALLFLGGLAGIGFKNVYIDKVIGLFMYLLSSYLFFLIFKTKFDNKYVKIALATLFGLLVLLSLPFILFNIADIYSTIHNGGVDLAREEIHSLNLDSSEIVVYRSNGGAASGFDISVVTEKTILPGMYIEHHLFDVYGADDISLSVVSVKSIKIDSINFTDPHYRSDYMNSNPKFVDGSVITIKTGL
jgi:hypothetical protein